MLKHPSPTEDQGANQQGALLFRGLGPLEHDRFEGTALIPLHRLMEAVDIAKASKVWESLNIGIEGKPFQLLGTGQVDTKGDVLHRPFFPLAGEVGT